MAFNRFDPECVRAQYPVHSAKLRTAGEESKKEYSFMDAWCSDNELVEVYGPQVLFRATPSDDCDAHEFMMRNRRRISI